jgi:hypothetical protein
MTNYQFHLVDRQTNSLMAQAWVVAETREDALAQRAHDWPRRSIRATSQAPFAS